MEKNPNLLKHEKVVVEYHALECELSGGSSKCPLRYGFHAEGRDIGCYERRELSPLEPIPMPKFKIGDVIVFNGKQCIIEKAEYGHDIWASWFYSIDRKLIHEDKIIKIDNQ